MTLLVTHYAVLCAFLLCHLYPAIWLLLPAYVVLGATLGPAWVCKWNLVVFFANRITCGQHECSSATHNDGIDHKLYCNRDERIRRLARWFHAVQDVGIFLGAVIASILIACAASDDGCFAGNIIFSNVFGGIVGNTTSIEKLPTKNHTPKPEIDPNILTKTAEQTMTNVLNEAAAAIASASNTASGQSINFLELYRNTIFRDEILNSMYDTNEHGARICGSDACPAWKFDTNMINNENGTDQSAIFNSNLYRPSDTIPITIVYLLLAIVALIFSCISQQVDNTLRYENKKSVRDTLLLAGPMAYFIGSEQGYMLGDFTRVSVGLYP